MASSTRVNPEERPLLTLQHICEALSSWTGIPAGRLVAERDGASLPELRPTLEERIFGQPAAIEAVTRGLARRFRIPERDGVRRPVWTALFHGPTGVGKTELARQLALHFFGDAGRHLVKIDLSELRDEHTIARLVGAPPGYKGHGDGGELTNALRRTREGVLLLDEVEKAHPAIITSVILPMIGEGVVHDMNDGRALDVTNMIVIMTTNLTERSEGEHPVGFGSNQTEDGDVIRVGLPPEVLSRIDDVVRFTPLSRDSIQQIWRREIAALEERLGGSERWRVIVTTDAEEVLLNQIDRSVGREGARAVIRFFDRAIVDRCLALRSDGRMHEGTMRVELIDGESLRYSIAPLPDPSSGPGGDPLHGSSDGEEHQPSDRSAAVEGAEDRPDNKTVTQGSSCS